MTTIIIMKFKIAEGREKEFEHLIEEKTRGLKKTPGFKQIYLLAPIASKEYRLVSWWEKMQDHEAWVRTVSYDLSHSASHPGLVVGTVPYEVATVLKQW